MEIKVKKHKGELEVDVTLDSAKWQKSITTAEKSLAANIQLKGFRKGKVPFEMAKKYLNKDAIYNKVLNKILQETYKEVLEHEEVKNEKIFSRPKIDVKSIDDNNCELSFIIDILVEPKIGNYKDLTLSKFDEHVSDKEVQEGLDILRNKFATFRTSESGVVKKGDTVIFDFEGYKGGKKFENGSAKNYELEVGSNKFIPGFEDKMVGLAKGEEKTLKLKFPEDYFNDDLKGESVEFKVMIHDVKEKVFPTNEELVKEVNNPEFTTYEELVAGQKEVAMKHKKMQAKEAYEVEALEKILENSEIHVPRAMIEEEITAAENNIQSRLSMQGFKNMDDFFKLSGQSKEKFYNELEEDARMKIQTIMIFEEIAKKENIHIDEKEVKSYLEKIKKEMNVDVAKLKKQISAEELKFRVRNEKVIDVIMFNAKYK